MVSSFGRGFDSRQLHVKLPSATYVMNKSNDFLMASLLLVKQGSFFVFTQTNCLLQHKK